MDGSVFLPLVVWFFLGFLLLFRSTLPLTSRLTFWVIFAVQVLFWWPELKPVLQVLWQKDFSQLWPLAQAGLQFLLLSLLWIWPVTLLYVFYSSNDDDSAIMIQVLLVITLLLWGFYFVTRVLHLQPGELIPALF